MVYFLGRDVDVYITTEETDENGVMDGVFVVDGNPTTLTTIDGGSDILFAWPLESGSASTTGAIKNMTGVDLSIGAMDEDITYFGFRSVTKAEIKKETTISITRKKVDDSWEAIFNGARYGVSNADGSTSDDFTTNALAEPTTVTGYRLHVVIKSGSEVFSVPGMCIQSHSASLNADGTTEETIEFMSYIDPIVSTSGTGASAGQALAPLTASDL